MVSLSILDQRGLPLLVLLLARTVASEEEEGEISDLEELAAHCQERRYGRGEAFYARVHEVGNVAGSPEDTLSVEEAAARFDEFNFVAGGSL